MRHAEPQNRRHKPHPDLAGSTPKEIAAGAASLPCLALAAVLGRDPAFMAAVAALREQPRALNRFARRYAPKAGRGRRVIAHMLSAAAGEPDQLHARARLENLVPMTVWADVDLDQGERVRWGRSNAGYRRAAELVALRGAGLCLSARCNTSVPGQRLWCSVHEQRHHADRESDERSMRTVLDAAARVLDL